MTDTERQDQKSPKRPRADLRRTAQIVRVTGGDIDPATLAARARISHEKAKRFLAAYQGLLRSCPSHGALPKIVLEVLPEFGWPPPDHDEIDDEFLIWFIPLRIAINDKFLTEEE